MPFVNEIMSHNYFTFFFKVGCYVGSWVVISRWTIRTMLVNYSRNNYNNNINSSAKRNVIFIWHALSVVREDPFLIIVMSSCHKPGGAVHSGTGSVFKYPVFSLFFSVGPHISLYLFT